MFSLVSDKHLKKGHSSQCNILKQNQSCEFGDKANIFEKFKKKMFDFMCHMIGCYGNQASTGRGAGEPLPACPLHCVINRL